MSEMIQNIFTPDNVMFLVDGLFLTLQISLSVAFGSIIFGTILGLLRHYELPIFSQISTVYIEILRNTPLLLWMLGCSFLISGSTLVIKASFALFLYTSAVIAEILRGGLNSIPVGQSEAAYTQGFSVLQTLRYIILPQVFRKVTPSLLSQVITTIKDTSFLAGLGILELTRSGQVILGRATTSTEVFIIYAFLALIYFTVCFSLSILVRKREKAQQIKYGL